MAHDAYKLRSVMVLAMVIRKHADAKHGKSVLSNYAIAASIEEIDRRGRRLHRLYERNCNGEISEATYFRAVATQRDHLARLCRELGMRHDPPEGANVKPKELVLRHNTDPRGWPLIVERNGSTIERLGGHS